MRKVTQALAALAVSGAIFFGYVAAGETAPAPAPAPQSDTMKPVINVTYPSALSIATSASELTFTGTASDNVGVVAVKWSSNVFAGALATGTTSWRATIPLAIGTNRITFTAIDAAGNIATRNTTVTRR